MSGDQESLFPVKLISQLTFSILFSSVKIMLMSSIVIDAALRPLFHKLSIIANYKLLFGIATYMATFGFVIGTIR